MAICFACHCTMANQGVIYFRLGLDHSAVQVESHHHHHQQQQQQQPQQFLYSNYRKATLESFSRRELTRSSLQDIFYDDRILRIIRNISSISRTLTPNAGSHTILFCTLFSLTQCCVFDKIGRFHRVKRFIVLVEASTKTAKCLL